ncbi:MAG: DPP IV N-terminal domain-containing protein [Anaerolineae bacterium]|nr:DPP IV N-terminal domain-containing protein [Anaerolineae bacterium]
MNRRNWLVLLSLLWLIGCRGVLEVRFEREPSPSAPSLGKVAYIAGGDVWVMDLDTNQQVRLTRDGRNSRPRWSADGRWIAYQKGDQLWVVEVSTGKEWPVSDKPVEEFAWSPIENRLAYLSAASGLVIWRIDQQSPLTLVENERTFTLTHFAWDPTGKWLAYEAEHGGWSLHKVSLDRASLTLYTAMDMASIPRLAGWSVDGRWLLAWIGPASAMAEADGLPLCLIPATGGAPRCLEQKMLLYADWLSQSPSGQLALIAGGGRETWVNKRLAVVDPDSLAVHWLVDNVEQAPIQPAFSPNGKYLVYSAGPMTPAEAAYARRDVALAQRRIWVIEIPSGQRRQLTNDDRFRDECPLWSSDGGHILFVRLGEAGASLWLMESNGNNLRQVVSELTPKPDPTGEYGYVNWRALWDWWQPPQEIQRIAP